MNQDSNINREYKSGGSYLMPILIVLMLFGVFIIAFWDKMFVKIPPGHSGVKFETFFGGTVTDKYWNEGLAFVFPWDDFYIYDTRIISGQDTIDALTEDGLHVNAEISYRYRLERDSLGLMHKNLGLDYADKVVIPHVTAATRDIISRYRIDALYSTSRSDIQSDMLRKARGQVDNYYPITTLDLIVRNIELDSIVEKAIADKLVQEQEMLAYDFILEKEHKEEERKTIEARGIRQFTRTSGIDILQWKGIEATKELATSPNSKVVIIGTDSKEMPVILGGNN